MNLPYEKGWQLVSVVARPGEAALTWANIRDDTTWSARR